MGNEQKGAFKDDKPKEGGLASNGLIDGPFKDYGLLPFLSDRKEG